MQFNYNGQDYRIRFGYASLETNEKGKRGLVWGGLALTNVHSKHVRTFCSISRKMEPVFRTSDMNPTNWDMIAGDYCIRSPEDEFSKEEGRKEALTRALWQIKDKMFHVVAWESYFNRDQKSKKDGVPLNELNRDLTEEAVKVVEHIKKIKDELDKPLDITDPRDQLENFYINKVKENMEKSRNKSWFTKCLGKIKELMQI